MTMAVAITTRDNPYDPLDQWDDWLNFDLLKGYNTCAYLARVAKTSESLTDSENERQIEHAIDDIVRFDPFDIYKKVKHK